MIAMAMIVGMLSAPPARADGLSGLSYTTYYPTGSWSSPNINYLTPLSSGVVSTVNYNWGSGYVLDSGRYDGVVVKFTGYFKAETTGTYYFGVTADDGFELKVNNQLVVSYWGDQGPTFRSGAVNLTAGTVVPVNLWWYENGGGAVAQFYMYSSGSWVIVPSTLLATTSTYWQPSLCCGGSSTAFSINSTHATKINSFVARNTGDSKVSIEQIGNGNTIIVEQTGTKNNFVKYASNGSSNYVSVDQKALNNTQTNYTDITVNGNSNMVDIKQRTSADTGSFTKSVFANVSGDNNIVRVDQKNGGGHYASVNLSGGNKTVDITQQGSASHMASVTLSGQPTSLNLTQSGSTQQFYSITHNCATAGGCSAITVTQGN